MHTTILDIQKIKTRGERIPINTDIDSTSAQIVDRAGIPIILVGDSLGMVVLGHPTTIPVTVDEAVVERSEAAAGERGPRQDAARGAQLQLGGAQGAGHGPYRLRS